MRDSCEVTREMLQCVLEEALVQVVVGLSRGIVGWPENKNVAGWLFCGVRRGRLKHRPITDSFIYKLAVNLRKKNAIFPKRTETKF